MIVANILGVEGAGVVAFAVWIAMVLSPVVDVGCSLSVARFFADRAGRGDRDSAHVLAGFLVRRLLCYAALAVVAVVAIAGLMPDKMDRMLAIIFPEVTAGNSRTTVLLVVALTIAQALATFTIGYHRGAQEFGRLAKIALCALIVQIIAVAIGTLAYGTTGAIGGYVIGQAALGVFALPLALSGGRPEADLTREIWRYGRYAWAANMCNVFVWSRMEILFLQLYWGPAEVGLFSVAIALAALASQGPLLLTGAFLPVLAEMNGRGDRDEVQRTFASGTIMVALIALPACFGMAAIAQPMVIFIYGDAFAASGTATSIILLAAALSVSTVIGTHLVNALGRSDFIFWSSVIGGVLAVVLGLSVIPHFGLVGAAASRALVQIAAVLLGIWFITRRIGYAYPFARLLRLTLAAATCAAAAYAVTQIGTGPLKLVQAVLAGVIVYPVALRVVGALGPDERAAIDKLTQRFPPRSRPAANAFVSFLAPIQQT
ncbi:polysaccharide biosynthesis C-terminal domain-containing protein [Fulvimarina sp. MAC3]|uniref:oligosaccharide flippase family protein n=1 Tax=Fulvimarina sp. MAC3 TaxID=3148887 RepID=UPI0031FBC533